MSTEESAGKAPSQPVRPAVQPTRPRPPRGARPLRQMSEMELFQPVQLSFWQRIKYPLLWLGLAAFLSGLVYAFQYFDLAQYIDQKSLKELIAPLGSAAPAAYMGAFVIAMLLMVIPYGFMAGLAVLLFGMPWGILWTVLGATLSALITWGLSRVLGKRVLAKKADNPRWQNMNQRLEKDGFYYLLLIRTLSIVPFNVLNFACAFTKIRFRDFLLANLIGLIPSAFVYGYGTQILLDPKTPSILLYSFVAVIALVIVTPMIFRQARKQRRHLQRQKMHEAFHNPGS